MGQDFELDYLLFTKLKSNIELDESMLNPAS